MCSGPVAKPQGFSKKDWREWDEAMKEVFGPDNIPPHRDESTGGSIYVTPLSESKGSESEVSEDETRKTE